MITWTLDRQATRTTVADLQTSKRSFWTDDIIHCHRSRKQRDGFVFGPATIAALLPSRYVIDGSQNRPACKPQKARAAISRLLFRAKIANIVFLFASNRGYKVQRRTDTDTLFADESKVHAECTVTAAATTTQKTHKKLVSFECVNFCHFSASPSRMWWVL